MVHRCQHYTCIVTWSLGNESGYGPNHEACAALVRSVDATRPLQYEGGRQHDDAVFILGTGHGPKTGTRLLLWWCLFFVLSKNDMLCILIFSFSPCLLFSLSPFHLFLDPVTDFICPMYHSPAELSLVSMDPSETRPIVLCEYLHAMGNSSGNSHIYWDAFWNMSSIATRSMQGKKKINFIFLSSKNLHRLK